MQTLVSKKMSYLLRHAAYSEKVAMSPQGYVNISELIKWLGRDLNIQVTMGDIEQITQQGLKSRYKIINKKISAVNGHSLCLPEMIFASYNHKLGGHPRYLVHETYVKCLPMILRDGQSRMARKHVHLSMQPGKAGLQRKSKPTIAVYVDVKRAMEMGLEFISAIPFI